MRQTVAAEWLGLKIFNHNKQIHVDVSVSLSRSNIVKQTLQKKIYL